MQEWIIGIDLHSQRLHWTLPNLRTPEQSERWSDLMPLISWQLWLARDLVIENRLTRAICGSINLTLLTCCPINVVGFS